MYVLARNNSLVALDATTGKEIWVHENLQGIAPRGINYWESRDGRTAACLSSGTTTSRRSTRGRACPILLVRQRTARSICAKAWAATRDVGRVQSAQSRQDLREPDHPRFGHGRGLLRARPATCARSTSSRASSPGSSTRFPHPGEFGYETWPKDAWKYVGGANTWGEISVDPARGIAYFPTRVADLRLLRRGPARRQPLRHVAPRARRAHRQAPLALPDGASRSLGLRQRRRAAAHDHHATTAGRSTWLRRPARPAFSTCSIA